jgi:hypothetical protein
MSGAEMALPEQLSQHMRVGFWLRVGAWLIDAIAVTVPIQLIVAVLFNLTYGRVQASDGMITTYCTTQLPMSELPRNLSPPPAQDTNYASFCSGTLFGLETARWLALGHSTREGNAIKTTSLIYRLNTENRQITVVTLDGMEVLALVVYLIALENWTGLTLGKRVRGLRVVDRERPNSLGVPFRKALSRNVLIWAGALPLSALGYGYLDGSFIERAAAMALVLSWYVWIAVDFALKRDPIYDRLAGTMLLRT